VTTEVKLSGKVATIGPGVLQDVSGRVIETFAQDLARCSVAAMLALVALRAYLLGRRR